MTGQQSLESAKGIARVEATLSDMQEQINRRFSDAESRENERFEVIREDIREIRDAGKWGLRTAVALVAALIVAAFSFLLSSGAL